MRGFDFAIFALFTLTHKQKNLYEKVIVYKNNKKKRYVDKMPTKEGNQAGGCLERILVGAGGNLQLVGRRVVAQPSPARSLTHGRNGKKDWSKNITPNHDQPRSSCAY